MIVKGSLISCTFDIGFCRLHSLFGLLWDGEILFALFFLSFVGLSFFRHVFHANYIINLLIFLILKFQKIKIFINFINIKFKLIQNRKNIIFKIFIRFYLFNSKYEIHSLSVLHSPIIHSSPSYNPKKINNIFNTRSIPSPVLAEQATMFHFLSSISSNFNSSIISSGERASPKSYLLAYTNKGLSFSSSSYLKFNTIYSFFKKYP